MSDSETQGAWGESIPIQDSVVMGDVNLNITINPTEDNNETISTMSDELGISIMMGKEDSIPEGPQFPSDILAVRADKKGPKTVAILLMIGAILIAIQAYGDWGLNSAQDLSDSEVEEVLITLNSQSEVELSVDEYQSFHDAARDSGGYLIRAIGLGLAAIMILIGAPLLFKLNPLGAKLSIAGATIGFIGGVVGSYQLNQAAIETLHGPLSLTYEIMMYLCGVCMAVCIALAVMPLFNVAARMALSGEDKIVLVQEEE